jgi:hypothetical protein
MAQPLEVTDPADAKEAAEWGKAAKYMLGGEGPDGEDAEAGEEQQPEAREFRYRGKTLKVDPATHEVLESLRNEARGANGRLGSELARTRERLARMEATIAARAETKTEKDDDADLERLRPDPKLATRDIDAWQAQYDAFRDAKEARRLERLEQRYREDVSRNAERAAEAARTQAWADRFYDTYDHFADPLLKKIVTDAYLEHKDEIDGFGPEGEEEAHARLAELADQRLVRLRKAGKLADPEQTNPNTDNRRRIPTFESSARATQRKPDDSARSKERENFSAASWVARERQRMSGRTPRAER